MGAPLPSTEKLLSNSKVIAPRKCHHQWLSICRPCLWAEYYSNPVYQTMPVIDLDRGKIELRVSLHWYHWHQHANEEMSLWLWLIYLPET